MRVAEQDDVPDLVGCELSSHPLPQQPSAATGSISKFKDWVKCGRGRD